MDKSGASNPVIWLPTGGGALHGIGETVSPDLHTGTGNFTVPIAVPVRRWLAGCPGQPQRRVSTGEILAAAGWNAPRSMAQIPPRGSEHGRARLDRRQQSERDRRPAVEYRAPAYDADGDALTFSVVGTPPSWLGFDAGTATLCGTPPAVVTSYNVTLRADDGRGKTSDVTVLIAVTNAAPSGGQGGAGPTWVSLSPLN
jgi:hypothetical protein